MPDFLSEEAGILAATVGERDRDAELDSIGDA